MLRVLASFGVLAGLLAASPALAGAKDETSADWIPFVPPSVTKWRDDMAAKGLTLGWTYIGDTIGNSVLDNDSDADLISGDALQVSLLAAPAGQLTLNPDGTFNYKAPAAATTDAFYYQACDQSHSCSVGKVTITVTNAPQPLNRAPWVVDDALQLAPGAGVTQMVGGASRLSANDRDPDGGTLPHRAGHPGRALDRLVRGLQLAVSLSGS